MNHPAFPAGFFCSGKLSHETATIEASSEGSKLLHASVNSFAFRYYRLKCQAAFLT